MSSSGSDVGRREENNMRTQKNNCLPIFHISSCIGQRRSQSTPSQSGRENCCSSLCFPCTMSLPVVVWRAPAPTWLLYRPSVWWRVYREISAPVRPWKQRRAITAKNQRLLTRKQHNVLRATKNNEKHGIHFNLPETKIQAVGNLSFTHLATPTLRYS